MTNPPDDYDEEKLKRLFRNTWGQDPEMPDETLPDSVFRRRPNEELLEKEVQVIGVYEHPKGMFVLLRDRLNRNIPIWIGQPEAFSISIALEGAKTPRPITHDLIYNLVDKLGGKIDSITVDDLYNETFYAKILVQFDGKQMEVDARPSDAIAVALRAKAPIYVSESVLEEANVKWIDEDNNPPESDT